MPVAYLLFAVFWAGQHRLQADFTAFYTGAAVVARGLGGQLYDLDLQRRVQAELIQPFRFQVGDVLPFRSPPFTVLPLLPLASLSIHDAYYVWMAANLALFAAALAVLSASSPELRARPRLLCLLWLASLAFLPSLSALLLGQFSFLMLFLFVVGFELLRRGREVPAGLVLAGVALKPHLFLVVPLLLAAKARRGALMGLVVGLGVLSGLSLLMVGPSTWLSSWRPAGRPQAGCP